MAESVDALVSNTNGCKAVPVRPRLWVPKGNPDAKVSGFVVSKRMYYYNLYISNIMAKGEKVAPITKDLVLLTETERLKIDMYRSDMEKLRLFTQMLRTNELLKKATIHHK